MKETIQELIANSKTEEALELLKNCTDEALLLLARYNGAKKQYDMGMIDFGDWTRTQNQINYAALELAKNCGDNWAVFISYNHEDALAMQAVRNYLERNSVAVTVDRKDMQPGEDIKAFIRRAFDDNPFVVSIVSQNSLLSGWVSEEMTTARALNNRTTQWIPVSLDNSIFDDAFYVEANAYIDEQLEKKSTEMIEALQRKSAIAPLQGELNRLQQLKGNLGSTIADLRNMLITDISGLFFDQGMAKVLERIKKG